ncbi:hypothetical protein GGR58DRAFT_508866 [Xylaria digitata]|nr:hypothetical protein GGR58DRAFT_508866 [Xylaria digitata]
MPAKAHSSAHILKQYQVSQWFINARRRGGYNTSDNSLDRGGPGSAECRSMPTGEMSSSTPIPMATQVVSDVWAAMSPMDRWHHSPPEDEPAPLEVIRSAIQGCHQGGSAASMPNIGPFFLDQASSRSNSVHALELLSSSATSSGSSSNSWSSALSSNHWSDAGDGPSELQRQPRRRRKKCDSGMPVLLSHRPRKVSVSISAHSVPIPSRRDMTGRGMREPFISRLIGGLASLLGRET